MGLRISQDRVAEVIRLYREEKLSMEKVAACSGVSYPTVWKIIHQSKVAVRPWNKLNRTIFEEIAVKYLSGKSGPVLAAEYSVHKRAIYYALKQQGVDRRSASECHRIYELDESAFDLVTEESAYWIGFLMADGCVYHRTPGNKILQLSVGELDRDHLEKYRSFLNSTHPISFVENNRGYEGLPLYRVHIGSCRLVEAVEQFGVVPRKSIVGCRVIGLEYDRHFWRGMVDGDGFICWHDGNASYPCIGLVGCLPIVEQFVDYVRTVCPACRARPKVQESLYAFRATGSTAAEIIRALYEECTVALDRKLAGAREKVPSLR